MPVRIIEQKRGEVVVQTIKTGKTLKECATLKTAEVFCVIRNLPIKEERVKL